MTGEPMPRRLDYLPLRQLSPAEANPKGHDLAEIQASILRFGMIEVAAVLDERTGRLISGHGRLETLSAAEAAGLDLPDGMLADEAKAQAEAEAAAERDARSAAAAEAWASQQSPELDELLRAFTADRCAETYRAMMDAAPEGWNNARRARELGLPLD